MSLSRPLSRALALVAAPLLLASTLSAQSAPLRQGFFIGFGLGGAGGEVTGNLNASGGTGWVTLGGTVNQHWRLAADLQGFTSKDNDNANYGTTTFAALWYPSATGNFFVKGGIGAAEVNLTGPGPDGSGVGLGTAFGVGYDARVGKKISITPQVGFMGGSTGDIKTSGGSVIANDVHFGVATFSVGVVFH